MPSSVLLRHLAPNAVRVTHYNPSRGLADERPWLSDVLLNLPEDEKRGDNIQVNIYNNLVRACNKNGECFFSENSPSQLNIRKLRPYIYFDISQTALYAGLRRIDAGVCLTLNRAPDESFYGWGEWFNAFERKTGRIRLDNRNALMNEQDRITYSGLPFFISSKGYGFVLLNSHRSQWDLLPNKMHIQADGPGADYILIYGPTFKEILRTYTALTGRPPLLPRWGFGLWVTSYPQEHQDSVLAFIEQHRKRNIPLDAVILDYHWEERFHNFKWRSTLIPNPPTLIAGLNERGARLGLIFTSYLNTRNRPFQKWLLNHFGKNITPGLEKNDERALDEFAEANQLGYLAHKHVNWWFGTGGMLDFTNPGAVSWWQNKLRSLLEMGVVFFKNDDGEDLPDDAQASNGMDGREYHNIYGFYYGRATYQTTLAPQNITQEQATGQASPRSIIYARTAWLGSQRYPALFLGDQQANFESIRRSLRAGLNLGLAGFAYWTADVFGLSGTTTPEIHARYAQWALLSPVARYFVRPAKIDSTRFPWSHNLQVEANFRKYAQLRMCLLPYFNSLAHESYLTGMPIMRPLLLEFENDERLRSVEDQIMLGGSLLICPVLQPDAQSRPIILPQGQWHDFWSEKSWQGGTTIDYACAPDCLPILVRAGTILPMGPVIQNIPTNHVFDHLQLHIYGPYPAEGLFFDDDGYSTAYQQAQFSRTRLRAELTGNRLKVRISAAQGSFNTQVKKRQVEIFLQRAPLVEKVLVNGKPASFSNTTAPFQFSCEHIVAKDTLIEIMLHAQG